MNGQAINPITVAQQFFPELPKDHLLRPFGKGNINLSYYFERGEKGYLLQKINPDVFPSADLIIENIRIVREHLLQTDPDLALIHLISTADGAPAWVDPEGVFWRVMHFLEGSISYPVAPTIDHAYEGAKMIGRFLKGLSTLNPIKTHLIIPDFHNSQYRFQQLKKAIEADIVNRSAEVASEIEFIEEHTGILKIIEEAKLPKRVVHNDTKMDNILFSEKTGQPLGLIDWDTIMPGTILSDYGDLVRTSINPMAEDSDQLDQIVIDPELLRRLRSGFLYHLRDILNKEEKDLLSIAPQWITLEQAMRFLTDFLMGDVYYKTAFKEHNLVRARNQLRLFDELKNLSL